MITRTVAELLDGQVTLDVEGIDRIYLNAYQPMLQTGGGVVIFFEKHRGATVASTTLMAPMSRAFVDEVERFVERENLEVVRFKKGQRKDNVTKERLKDFKSREGVLYLGIAQEKFGAFRVEKKLNPETGKTFPWLSRSTVMCNQYYFYLVDEDVGPFFIKFSSYFPYTVRVCLNGHEYAKRQLEKKGIAHAEICCAAHQRKKLESQGQGRVPERQRSWPGPKGALLGAPRMQPCADTLPVQPLPTNASNAIVPVMSCCNPKARTTTVPPIS